MAKEKKCAADYEVGRGKPPKHTQFKPGQSGNPKGRPKGAKNTATMLQDILAELQTVREGGRVRKMSKKEVMLRVRVSEATGPKGSKAFDQIMRQLEKIEEKQGKGNGCNCAPVLIVPGVLSEEEWAKMAKEQQAKYAGNIGEKKDESER